MDKKNNEIDNIKSNDQDNKSLEEIEGVTTLVTDSLDSNQENELIIDSGTTDPEEILENDNKKVGKKKHGLPKTLIANQQKYLDVLKRQKKTEKGNQKTNQLLSTKKSNNVVSKGMRRVIIAGRVRYLPIKEMNISKQSSDIDKEQKDIIKEDHYKDNIEDEKNEDYSKEIPIIKKGTNTQTKNILDIKMNSVKKIPFSKQQINNTKKNMHGTSSSSIKRIPSKYAKQIENDVKKQTVKSIKNFSDLRRIRVVQEINPNQEIDTNRASIMELRKLRTEQRKKELAEQKQRNIANQRENAIQEILRNDKMSKFAKMVAVKNLSVNSRHRKANLNKHEIYFNQ